MHLNATDDDDVAHISRQIARHRLWNEGNWKIMEKNCMFINNHCRICHWMEGGGKGDKTQTQCGENAIDVKWAVKDDIDIHLLRR